MKIPPVAPNNPSIWNYLRGVLNNSKTPYSALKAFVELCFEAESILPDNSKIGCPRSSSYKTVDDYYEHHI